MDCREIDDIMNDWVIVNQSADYDMLATKCKNLVFMNCGNNFQNILKWYIKNVRIL